MTELNQIYKCSVCGNVVEIVHTGGGTLVCCGKPMDLKKANTQDASLEKHVPAVEKQNDGLLVKVGSVEHPMEEKHYIEWIEVIADGRVLRQNLKPGDKTEAFFHVAADKTEVRAYCNIHGLWKA